MWGMYGAIAGILWGIWVTQSRINSPRLQVSYEQILSKTYCISTGAKNPDYLTIRYLDPWGLPKPPKVGKTMAQIP